MTTPQDKAGQADRELALPQGYEQRPWDYRGQLYIESQMRSYAHRYHAAKLEQYGKGFEEWMKTSHRASFFQITAEEAYQAGSANGAASCEPEIQALREELAEEEAIRERCAQLLAKTAVALKGEEAPLQRHGWQDLPEVAKALREEVERLKGECLGLAMELTPGRKLLAAQLSERKLREALIMIYDKWENGQDCYEDVEELSGYSGKAVNLSEEEENQILSLIPSVLNGNTSPTNTDEADKLIKALDVAKDAMEFISTEKAKNIGSARIVASETLAAINELGMTK